MKKLIILALTILSALILTSCDGTRHFQDYWVDIADMPTPTYKTEIYCTKEYCCENTKHWNNEVNYSNAYNVDCVPIPGYSGNCEGHLHYVITYTEYK